MALEHPPPTLRYVELSVLLAPLPLSIPCGTTVLLWQQRLAWEQAVSYHP